jgi:GR25 family glycosyltransferase involved in LPS biosynthesis
MTNIHVRDISINLRNLNILYINLDRRPERRQNIENELQRLGLSGTRISGVDGLQMPQEEVDFWMKKTNFNTMTRQVDKVMAKVGCLLSHIKALKYAIDNGFNNVLILEDDAKFLIKDSNFILKIPSECDIYYLGGLFWWKTSETPLTDYDIEDMVKNNILPDLTFENVRDNNYYQNKIQILPKFFRIACTFGYVLHSKDNIKYIYNTLINSKQKAVDMMYVTYVQKDDNCYIINPPILVQSDAFESDVTDIGSNTPKRPYNNSYFYDRNIYTYKRVSEFYSYNYSKLLELLKHVYRKNKVLAQPNKLFKHLRLLYKNSINEPNYR